MTRMNWSRASSRERMSRQGHMAHDVDPPFSIPKHVSHLPARRSRAKPARVSKWRIITCEACGHTGKIPKAKKARRLRCVICRHVQEFA